VLAACALLGVTEVHAAGGAQALAMFAYGTADCPSADVITGPGNVYVAAAKRVLRGVVGTDGEAGPTEVAIIADDTADPRYVAADLVAQAEHDELAACLLITTDAALAGQVDAELTRQVAGPGTASGCKPLWPASPPASSSTTRTRRSPSATPGRPSTWRSRPGTRPSWRRG
jgi:histidinol dehydrogenase